MGEYVTHLSHARDVPVPDRSVWPPGATSIWGHVDTNVDSVSQLLLGLRPERCTNWCLEAALSRV